MTTVVGRWIDVRIVVVVAPHTFAFPFPEFFQFGHWCFLPAGRADIPDRVEEHTALRTISERVRRRGP